MKNKRGSIQWEEDKVGRLIIAIVCILILVFLGVHLYRSLTAGGALKEAESSLNKLSSDLNAKNTESQIYNPSGWYLESFPMTVKNVAGQSSDIPVPSLCAGVNWTKCLCMCEYNFQGSPSCDGSNSICIESDFVVEAVSAGTWSGVREIFISNPPVSLEINQISKTIKQK